MIPQTTFKMKSSFLGLEYCRSGDVFGAIRHSVPVYVFPKRMSDEAVVAKAIVGRAVIELQQQLSQFG